MYFINDIYIKGTTKLKGTATTAPIRVFGFDLCIVFHHRRYHKANINYK